MLLAQGTNCVQKPRGRKPGLQGPGTGTASLETPQALGGTVRILNVTRASAAEKGQNGRDSC